MKLKWTLAAICVALACAAGMAARADVPDGTRNYIEGNLAFQVITRQGKVTLVAMDPTNKLNFEGPINTAAEIARVPREVLTGYRMACARGLFPEVTPEEWQVIAPRLRRVIQVQDWLAAALDADPLQLSAEPAPLDPDNPLTPCIKKVLAAVNAEPNDPAYKDAVISYRDAHKKLREDLTTAQSDLMKILTVKQEFLLMRIGILY